MNKIISIIILACFTLTSVGGQALNAAAAELRAPAASRPIAPLFDVVIPQEFGRITDGALASSGQKQIVINIQDLHCNPEVQRNISSILEQLEKRYGLSAVYVEGGYGNIDTSWLCNMSNEATKKNIANALVSGGRLTGSEYYSVTANKPHLLKGLEDEAVHKANIVRLGEIIKRKESVGRILKEMEHELSYMEANDCCRQSRKFNETVQQHTAGRLSTENYYRLLQGYVEKVSGKPKNYHALGNIRMADFPTLKAYIELTHIAKDLKYKNISRQLRPFMQVVKSNISFMEYNDLSDKTDNFSRTNELYFYLGAIAQNPRIAQQCRPRYPELYTFFDYTARNRQINPLSLITEEKRLTEALRIAFAQNTPDLEVSYLADFMVYFKQYLSGSIAADDYQYVSRQLPAFVKTWKDHSITGRIDTLSDDLDRVKEYYDTNCRRNECFLTNANIARSPCSSLACIQDVPPDALSRALKSSQLTVMVTGGFHSEGLKALLQNKGIAYITITPNVTLDTDPAKQLYEMLAQQQAKTFAKQSLALALGSTNAKVITSGNDKFVVELNDDQVTLIRKGEGFVISGSSVRRGGNSARSSAVTSGVKEALAITNKFLHTESLMLNPALSAELIYQLVKTFSLWSAREGIYTGNGLIWSIATDPAVQDIINTREGVTLEDLNQLPDIIQRLTAGHASQPTIDAQVVVCALAILQEKTAHGATGVGSHSEQKISSADKGGSYVDFKIGSRKFRIMHADGVVKSNYYGDFMVESAPMIVEDLKRRGNKLKRVFEVGSGKGAMITAFGLLTGDDTKLIGIDINDKAVALIKQNVTLNGLENKVKVKKGNVIDDWDTEGPVDLILADFPMIPVDPVKYKSQLDEQAFKEINGGADGRYYTDMIIRRASRYLADDGAIAIVQPDFNGVEKTLKLLNENGFEAHVIAKKKQYLDETTFTRNNKDYIEGLGNDYRFATDETGRLYFNIVIIEGIKIKTGASGAGTQSISGAKSQPLIDKDTGETFNYKPHQKAFSSIKVGGHKPKLSGTVVSVLYPSTTIDGMKVKTFKSDGPSGSMRIAQGVYDFAIYDADSDEYLVSDGFWQNFRNAGEHGALLRFARKKQRWEAANKEAVIGYGEQLKYEIDAIRRSKTNIDSWTDDEKGLIPEAAMMERCRRLLGNSVVTATSENRSTNAKLVDMPRTSNAQFVAGLQQRISNRTSLTVNEGEKIIRELLALRTDSSVRRNKIDQLIESVLKIMVREGEQQPLFAPIPYAHKIAFRDDLLDRFGLLFALISETDSNGTYACSGSFIKMVMDRPSIDGKIRVLLTLRKKVLSGELHKISESISLIRSLRALESGRPITSIYLTSMIEQVLKDTVRDDGVRLFADGQRTVATAGLYANKIALRGDVDKRIDLLFMLISEPDGKGGYEFSDSFIDIAMNDASLDSKTRALLSLRKKIANSGSFEVSESMGLIRELLAQVCERPISKVYLTPLIEQVLKRTVRSDGAMVFSADIYPLHIARKKDLSDKIDILHYLLNARDEHGVYTYNQSKILQMLNRDTAELKDAMTKQITSFAMISQLKKEVQSRDTIDVTAAEKYIRRALSVVDGKSIVRPRVTPILMEILDRLARDGEKVFAGSRYYSRHLAGNIELQNLDNFVRLVSEKKRGGGYQQAEGTSKYTGSYIYKIMMHIPDGSRINQLRDLEQEATESATLTVGEGMNLVRRILGMVDGRNINRKQVSRVLETIFAKIERNEVMLPRYARLLSGKYDIADVLDAIQTMLSLKDLSGRYVFSNSFITTNLIKDDIALRQVIAERYHKTITAQLQQISDISVENGNSAIHSLLLSVVGTIISRDQIEPYVESILSKMMRDGQRILLAQNSQVFAQRADLLDVLDIYEKIASARDVNNEYIFSKDEINGLLTERQGSAPEDLKREYCQRVIAVTERQIPTLHPVDMQLGMQIVSQIADSYEMYPQKFEWGHLKLVIKDILAHITRNNELVFVDAQQLNEIVGNRGFRKKIPSLMAQLSDKTGNEYSYSATEIWANLFARKGHVPSMVSLDAQRGEYGDYTMYDRVHESDEISMEDSAALAEAVLVFARQRGVNPYEPDQLAKLLDDLIQEGTITDRSVRKGNQSLGVVIKTSLDLTLAEDGVKQLVAGNVQKAATLIAQAIAKKNPFVPFAERTVLNNDPKIAPKLEALKARLRQMPEFPQKMIDKIRVYDRAGPDKPWMLTAEGSIGFATVELGGNDGETITSIPISAGLLDENLFSLDEQATAIMHEPFALNWRKLNRMGGKLPATDEGYHLYLKAKVNSGIATDDEKREAALLAKVDPLLHEVVNNLPFELTGEITEFFPGIQLAGHVALNDILGLQTQAKRAARFNGLSVTGENTRKAKQVISAAIGGFKGSGRFSFIMIGSGGRGEMCYKSDIDYILLHDDKMTPKELEEIASRAGAAVKKAGFNPVSAFKVGTISTIMDNAEISNIDKWVMYDMAYVCGDQELYGDLESSFKASLANKTQDDRDRFALKWYLLEKRLQNLHSDDPAQPNVKNSKGSLKDIQHIELMAKMLYGISGTDITEIASGMVDKGVLTLAEADSLVGSAKYIFAVRNQLHLLADEEADVLTEPVQKQLAQIFGYVNGADFLGEYKVKAGALYEIAEKLRNSMIKEVGERRGHSWAGMLNMALQPGQSRENYSSLLANGDDIIWLAIACNCKHGDVLEQLLERIMAGKLDWSLLFGLAKSPNSTPAIFKRLLEFKDKGNGYRMVVRDVGLNRSTPVEMLLTITKENGYDYMAVDFAEANLKARPQERNAFLEKEYQLAMVEPLAKARALGKADIVIGIPYYMEQDTIENVFRKILDGLNRDYPGKKCVILCAGNPDNQRTRDIQALINKIGLKGQTQAIAYLVPIAGKGMALRSMMEMAETMDSDVCGFIDADERAITEDWAPSLAAPVLSGQYDYVSPRYTRHHHTATITNHFGFPLVSTVYGKQVRQPMGGEFAMSKEMIKVFLKDPDIWYTNVGGYGVDNWLTITAITNFKQARICEVDLGTKIHNLSSFEKRGSMFKQVAGQLFATFKQTALYWMEIMDAMPNQIVGSFLGIQPAANNADYRIWIDKARENYKKCNGVLSKVLGPDEGKAIAAMFLSENPEDIELSSEKWIGYVYDFIIAYAFKGLGDTKEFWNALEALWEVRAGTFIRQTQDLPFQDAEKLVNAQTAAFIARKPDFVSKWKQSELELKARRPRLEIINPELKADVKVVVFDWDGTIMNLIPEWKDTLRDVLTKELGAQVADFPTSHGSVGAIGWALREAARLGIVSKKREVDFTAQYVAAMNRLVEGMKDSELLITGAQEVVASIHATGAKLIVLSAGYHKEKAPLVKRFGLDTYFDEVIARRPGILKEQNTNKFKIDKLVEIKRKYGLTGAQVAIVGDNVIDIRAAKAAGAIAVGIAANDVIREKLINEGADVIINGDYEDVKTRLADILHCNGLQNRDVKRILKQPMKTCLRVYPPNPSGS